MKVLLKKKTRLEFDYALEVEEFQELIPVASKFFIQFRYFFVSSNSVCAYHARWQ
jgi:hypothetical protein